VLSPLTPMLHVRCAERLASDRTNGAAKAASVTYRLTTRLIFGLYNCSSSFALGFGQTRRFAPQTVPSLILGLIRSLN